jgi:hypothetical protein
MEGARCRSAAARRRVATLRGRAASLAAKRSRPRRPPPRGSATLELGRRRSVTALRSRTAPRPPSRPGAGFPSRVGPAVAEEEICPRRLAAGAESESVSLKTAGSGSARVFKRRSRAAAAQRACGSGPVPEARLPRSGDNPRLRRAAVDCEELCRRRETTARLAGARRSPTGFDSPLWRLFARCAELLRRRVPSRPVVDPRRVAEPWRRFGKSTCRGAFSTSSRPQAACRGADSQDRSAAHSRENRGGGRTFEAKHEPAEAGGRGAERRSRSRAAAAEARVSAGGNRGSAEPTHRWSERAAAEPSATPEGEAAAAARPSARPGGGGGAAEPPAPERRRAARSRASALEARRRQRGGRRQRWSGRGTRRPTQPRSGAAAATERQGRKRTAPTDPRSTEASRRDDSSDRGQIEAEPKPRGGIEQEARLMRTDPGRSEPGQAGGPNAPQSQRRAPRARRRLEWRRELNVNASRVETPSAEPGRRPAAGGAPVRWNRTTSSRSTLFEPTRCPRDRRAARAGDVVTKWGGAPADEGARSSQKPAGATWAARSASSCLRRLTASTSASAARRLAGVPRRGSSPSPRDTRASRRSGSRPAPVGPAYGGAHQLAAGEPSTRLAADAVENWADGDKCCSQAHPESWSTAAVPPDNSRGAHQAHARQDPHPHRDWCDAVEPADRVTPPRSDPARPAVTTPETRACLRLKRWLPLWRSRSDLSCGNASAGRRGRSPRAAGRRLGARALRQDLLACVLACCRPRAGGLRVSCSRAATGACRAQRRASGRASRWSSEPLLLNPSSRGEQSPSGRCTEARRRRRGGGRWSLRRCESRSERVSVHRTSSPAQCPAASSPCALLRGRLLSPRADHRVGRHRPGTALALLERSRERSACCSQPRPARVSRTATRSR